MKTMSVTSPDFEAVHGLITLRRSCALQAVNNENLLAAWGGKTVSQFAEYLRAQDPTLRGYSRRNIYNMVALFDTYSSPEFLQYAKQMNLGSIVQPVTAQIENGEIVQQAVGQTEDAEIVQFQTAQFPDFLNLTTLTNHFEILNACRNVEEVLQHSLETFSRFLGFNKEPDENNGENNEK